MQSLQQYVLQKLIKLVSPNSPVYGNTIAFEKQQTSKDIESKLQPGDIIFSRTNSNIAEIARKYMGINYDHVAVVINEREVVHVSPPIISKLDMSYIMHPGRQPLIIRPKLQDIQKFLVITQNYLGQKYNLKALWQLTFRQLKSKLKQQQKNQFSLTTLKHSRICSDSVLYALLRASPQIQKSLQNQIKKTKYQNLGFFLPDQVAEIVLVNGGQIILKSKLQNQYKLIKTLESGGEKVFSFLQKSIKYTKISTSQLTDIVSKWKKQKKQNNLKNQAINGFQVISLIMSLAHLMGVVTLSAKTRLAMLVLHTMIMVGQFQAVRKLVLSKQSRL